jgi:hypothetical protein
MIKNQGKVEEIPTFINSLISRRPSHNKFSGGKMKKLDETITFKTIDNLALEELTLTGTIKGFAKQIKQIQPVEYGELPEDEEVYLVKVKGRYFVVFPEEIVKEEK